MNDHNNKNRNVDMTTEKGHFEGKDYNLLEMNCLGVVDWSTTHSE